MDESEPGVAFGREMGKRREGSAECRAPPIAIGGDACAQFQIGDYSAD